MTSPPCAGRCPLAALREALLLRRQLDELIEELLAETVPRSVPGQLRLLTREHDDEAP